MPRHFTLMIQLQLLIDTGLALVHCPPCLHGFLQTYSIPRTCGVNSAADTFITPKGCCRAKYATTGMRLVVRKLLLPLLDNDSGHQ